MARKTPLSADKIRKYTPNLSESHPRDRLGCGDGLYLLFTLAGARSWQCRVRMPGGDSLITLGEYGEASEGKINLTEARRRQHEAIRRMENGEPPAQIKFGVAAVKAAERKKQEEEKAAGPTFGEIAEAWMAQAGGVDAVQKRRRNRFRDYLEAPLGARPIASITQDELVAAAKSPLVKSVSGRPALSVPQALTQMISQVYDYARMTRPELASCNTDAHLVRLVPNAPPPQHRPCIVDPGELGELLRKIGDLYLTCRNPATGLAMRMLPLVALRPGEVARAVWDEIDFGKCLWSIPMERMKLRRPHLVPLSSQAMAILHEAKKFAGDSEYIFPSYSSEKCGHVCLNTPIQTLHRLGYDTGKDICPHGFRGTFSTLLNESGLFREKVIEVQLAHVEKSAVKAAYNHAVYMEERREMMQTWADYLDALRDGSTQTLREWAKSRPKVDPFEGE